MALHWFGGYVSSFSLTGFFLLVFRIRQCHRESFPRSQLVVVICMWFLLAAGVRPKETSVGCSCLLLV